MNREKDMKKKVTVLTLSIMLFALCLSVDAQQPTKIPRIGYLTGQSQASSESGPNIDAFRRGLREFGYIEEITLLSSTEARRVSSIGCPRLPRN